MCEKEASVISFGFTRRGIRRTARWYVVLGGQNLDRASIFLFFKFRIYCSSICVRCSRSCNVCELNITPFYQLRELVMNHSSFFSTQKLQTFWVSWKCCSKVKDPMRTFPAALNRGDESPQGRIRMTPTNLETSSISVSGFIYKHRWWWNRGHYIYLVVEGGLSAGSSPQPIIPVLLVKFNRAI